MKLREQNKLRINALRDKMTQAEFTKMLIDLYELEDLNPLMQQIRRRYHTGISPQLMTQLSILFTQLASIFKQL